jgi:PAS domain S-box-containing protein
VNRTLRVLVVEDCENDALLLLRELQRAGYAVTSKRVDTESGMQAALAEGGFDVVISDFSMPTFGALAALELLKASGHDLPFLIVSGTIGEETAVECLRAGAHDFLVKGRLTRLPNAIEREIRAANSRGARKQAEAALRESEQRFRQIAENINEVFWMTDVEKQKMLYISPGYEQIWGRTCESLYQTPRNWLDAIHPEDRQRVLDAAIKKQERGDYDETYRIVRPDGTARWIHDRAFPIRDGTNRVIRVAGIAADITDYRQLEKQFRQAQKMEAIGTLAGGIAHDFNNILAAITGFATLGRIAASGNAEVTEYLDEISLAGTRAADLVRQILAFSRQQEQRRAPIQLNQVVAESLRMLRATIPATVGFKIEMSADLPAVLADATQIHQVVMNLGTNAWHAMRDRPGHLEVRLEEHLVDEQVASLHAGLHPGRYVCLSVSDTGHGMDQATRDRIFEPFFTTKAPGEGTGLGLSVVHGIMQGHGGVITVNSEPGEGTVFHLFFPAAAVEEPELATIAESIPRGEGQRILVVDDEEQLARLGKKMLDQLGYAAEVFTNPGEALAAVRSDPDRFDLVITDQTMPLMTGMDLARQLLQLQPGLPIILTTGHSGELRLEQALAAGIRELLMKPNTHQLLGTTVHRLLAKGVS